MPKQSVKFNNIGRCSYARGRTSFKAISTLAGIVVFLVLVSSAYWLYPSFDSPNKAASTAQMTTLPSTGSDTSTTTLLTMAGSNTIGKELAPMLAEEFLRLEGAQDIKLVRQNDTDTLVQGKQDGKRLLITILAHGSGTAFDALAAQQADIGMSSRPINTAEAQKLSHLGDMTSPTNEHILAADGLAIIVPNDNPIKGLSKEQIRAIFSGHISDWQTVKGKPGKINLYARDDKSGTFDTFKSLILNNAKLAEDAQRFVDSQLLSESVADDPNAIGFVGMPFIGRNKALAISEAGTQALMPNRFTVKTEDYALSRRLYLYTASNPVNPNITKFIRYALSTEGQSLAAKAGFVELNVETASPTKASILPTNSPKEYIKLTTGARRLSLNFYFHSSSFSLDNKALQDIERIKSWLSKTANRHSKVMLFGFADNKGNPLLNEQLSKKRAQSVALILQQHGIHPIIVKSFGNSMPVASNLTPEGQAKNRRVEIWVKS